MYAQPLVLVSLLAGIVAAQVSTAGLPKCAGSCVTDFGGCQQLDVKCICSNEQLLADLACCVSKECNADDQQATIDFANSLCAGQGVDNLPQTATCAASASASTSASSSVSESASGSVSSVSSSTSVFTADSSTFTITNTRGATATATDLAAGSGAAQSSSASASASAATATGEGAAANNKVEGLGLGMIFAGLVAAL